MNTTAAMQGATPAYEQWKTTFDWAEAAQQLGVTLDGPVNKAITCWERHAQNPAMANQEALTWLGTHGQKETFTFAQLAQQANQFAHVLHAHGIGHGDRVFVFLERVPELFVAIMGALKLGAVAGPLFSAFGPEAIRDRLADCKASLVVTSPVLKPKIDAIRPDVPELHTVIVVDRQHHYSPLCASEFMYHEAMANAPTTPFEPATPTMAHSSSIIHYTSGTTGKPKGAIHCHGAVIAQAATAQAVLDLHPPSTPANPSAQQPTAQRDVYWCTADPGWVTGTAYGMFGPWALGAHVLVYEGPFSAAGWYQIIQDHKVTVWYTAPTAIRLLMKAGADVVKQFDLSSLRHLCSVGEPLNPEAEVWGEQVFGHTFHDTWWQTETGCMHVTNYPFMPIKHGSMGKPIPGVQVGILDDAFEPTVPVGEQGHLAIKTNSPSFFKGYWGREDLTQSRFKNGWYLTGDLARVDADGYYWFIGRSDDVINTAGHLVGPFEVESVLIEHPAVAEAGVIGKPDPERLEIIKAFVALKAGFTATDELKQDIQQFVRSRLAGHAYPRELAFIDSLPKTRSGKIMRRLLKARELGLPEGDTSTLED
jgi:acetyl-CoA synthetase